MSSPDSDWNTIERTESGGVSTIRGMGHALLIADEDAFMPKHQSPDLTAYMKVSSYKERLDKVSIKFADRTDAGRQLADWTVERFGAAVLENAVILACSNGGVPVGLAMQKRLAELSLRLELQIAVVRKLGMPHNRQSGCGVMCEDGEPHYNEFICNDAKIDRDLPAWKDYVQERRKIMQERKKLYRGGRDLELSGRTVIIVDDGVCNGVTSEGARRAAEAAGAQHILFAMPVLKSSVLEKHMSVSEDNVARLYDLTLLGWNLDDFYADGKGPISCEVVQQLLKIRDLQ